MTMRSFAGRHSTLLVFSLCLGSSTAFVACGDDPVSTNYDFDAGEAGSANNGGTPSTGGRGNGGAPTTGGRGNGGSGTGGVGTGGAGTGGAPVIDSGPDAITSNGDAATD